MGVDENMAEGGGEEEELDDDVLLDDDEDEGENEMDGKEGEAAEDDQKKQKNTGNKRSRNKAYCLPYRVSTVLLEIACRMISYQDSQVCRRTSILRKCFFAASAPE